MFVCPQISTVKHLWVDLHDEVDRFVFWQYICHPCFTCQEVRCALGVIRWLISVLWDVLPCLLCFKWQKTFFLALAAGIHISSATVCVFLLPKDWKGFLAHEQRECLWTQHHVGGKLNPFPHTLIHLRVQSTPMACNTYLDPQHSHITSCTIPLCEKCTLTRANKPWAHC